MSLDILFNNIQSVAVFIGALTVIGSALIWVYQQTIGKAKDKRAEERTELLRKKIDASNAPLIETLNRLDQSMKERKDHGEKLDAIAEQNVELLRHHDQQLEKHNERIVVLEVINGVRKVGFIDDKEGAKT